MTSPRKATDERRIKLLRAAGRVSKSAATILDPAQLIQQTVDLICNEFDFYYAGVFLLDDRGEWAVLQSGFGEAGKAMLKKEHRLKVGGNSMIGVSLEFREARIALDVGDEAVHFVNPHLPKTRSEMALPLIVADTVLGALTVQSVEESAFSQDDIETLQAMADQLAIAIQNARLHKENQLLLKQAERRATLFSAANQVGKSVSSILDIEQLLPKTVDVICDAYGFYYAGVFLLDESGEYAELRAGYGEDGQAMLAEGHKLKAGGNSMIGRAISSQEARISLDVDGESVFFRNPHLPKTRSEMALPLVIGDNVLGAVTVQSTEESAFSDEDISTLQTMVEHLAIAINNANLLNELERAHAELLRTKTYEALSSATTEAIHWIGNKALPITTTIARLREDVALGNIDLDDLNEDLDLIGRSASLIVNVKENLIGSAREHQPRAVLLSDIWETAAFHRNVPIEKLSITTHPDSQLAIADSTQLVRAFGNLLQNALEASADRISIEISPANQKGYVLTNITDNGSGIPDDIQEKIWASFFTTKGTQNQGLGLASCLHVISQLDGHIQVESKVNHGTTFTILLPAAETNEPVDLMNFPDKISVLASNGAWSRQIKGILQKYGKQISNKAELDTALILLDEMVAVDHLDDLGGLKKKTVIISAALVVERTTKYLRTGVKDVVLKPYTAHQLESLLN